MRLRLRVRAPALNARVAVEAAPDTPMRDVWSAITAELGIGDDERSRGVDVERLGRVQPDATISDLGLRHGDTLVVRGLGPPSHDPRGAVLEVVGGPGVGCKMPLRRGIHELGRDPDCTYALEGDTTVGRRHARIEVDADRGRVTVSDLGSRNGTFVNGRPIDGTHTVGEGDVVRIGKTLLMLRSPSPTAAPDSVRSTGTVAFNRPPPPAELRYDDPITVSVPSTHGSRSPIQLGAIVLPILMGVLFWQLFGQVYMLLFTLLSPAILIWTRVSESRADRRSMRIARRDFDGYLAQVERDAGTRWDEEFRWRHQRFPGPGVLIGAAAGPAPPLWVETIGRERPPRVRIGCGTRRSLVEVHLGEGDDDLLQTARRRLEPYERIGDVPVALDLEGVVGLVGDADEVRGLATWLGLALAATYSPTDVVLAVITDERGGVAFDPLAWVPHTRPEGFDAALLTSHAAGASRLIGVLDERLDVAQSSFGEATGRPHVVLFVDGDAVGDRGQLAQVLEAADRGGAVSVVWLASHANDLPRSTRRSVSVVGDRFRMDDLRGGASIEGTIDDVSDQLCERLAVLLAPITDAAARSHGQLPELVRISDLPGAGSDPALIARHWADPPAGLRAAIGMSAEGPVTLDIEADGPHGLVGGTTGAGKSELLQSLVASLVTAYPPSRLNFLFVDYKGGSAFGECAELPHTAGIVTDLDPALAQRALTALNAEVRRREHVIADARCSDLAELRASGRPAPASLLIVVDEFATLANELPEFIDGVVDVARRGRSLGMHLVLATQSPDQAISKAIQDNTNWRIALRVTSDAASINVIGSPVAAEIDPRAAGRGVLKIATRRPVLFQSTYVGARGESGGVTVEAAPFGWVGRARRSVAGVGASDLDRIVAAVRQAAAGHAPIHRPWVPALGDVVDLDELAEAPGFALGVWDRPELQRHDTFAIDLSRTPIVLAYGGPASGKTTLLRTLATSASTASDPVWIYAVDGGGGGLESLQALPTVGAVTRAVDIDEMMRLIAVLESIAEHRRIEQVAAGAARYDDLGVDARPPRVLVLVDDYRGLAGSIERVDHGTHLDRIHRLATTGPGFGIHFVITASRRSDVPGMVAGTARHVIALPLPSVDEYAQLGLPLRALPSHLPPGRAIIESNQFVQIAVLGENHTSIAQDLAVRRAAATIAADPPPPRLEVLGAEIGSDRLPEAPDTRHVPIGFGEDLQVVVADLSDLPLLIAGPPRSGRSTALATVVTQMRPVLGDRQFWLLAPRRTPLTGLAGWDRLATGIDGCESAIAALDELGAPQSVVVVIDDGEELVDGPQARTLETLARRARNTGMLIVGAAEISSAHRAFASWISELRKSRSGVLLTPDLDVDGDLLGIRLPRSTRRQFPSGRGYLVQAGVATMVQVAVTDG